MSTAQEILAKMYAGEKVVHRMAKHREQMMLDLLRYGSTWVVGARVGVQHARTLRRRGEHVVWVGKTSTGKAIYSWMRPVPTRSVFTKSAAPVVNDGWF